MRNALINNFNPIELGGDLGSLWENYVLRERVKALHYQRQARLQYFWRTYEKQEIDLVEEHSGKLDAFEIKWNPRRKTKVPTAWRKHYPDATFEVITPTNFLN